MKSGPEMGQTIQVMPRKTDDKRQNFQMPRRKSDLKIIATIIDQPTGKKAASKVWRKWRKVKLCYVNYSNTQQII